MSQLSCQCDLNALSKALSLADRVARTGGYGGYGYPGLGNAPALKLSVAEGKLTVWSAGAHISLQITVPVDEGVDGEVVVTSSLIAPIVQKLDDDDDVVKLECDKKQLRIACGITQIALLCHPKWEAKWIEAAEGETVVMQSSDLIDSVKLVRFARDKKHPLLEGVLLDNLGDDKLRFVCTDTYRLAWREIEAEGVTSALPEKNLVLPDDLVSVLTHVSELNDQDDCDAVLTVDVDNLKITVETNGTYITGTLLSGVYPDYKGVIPDQISSTLSVDRDLLTRSADRISLIAKDTRHIIQLAPQNTTLVVNAFGEEGDNAKDEIACELSGEPPTVDVSARYLSEGIAAFDAGQLDIGFAKNTSNSLMLVTRPESPTTQGYLLMPIIGKN